MTIISFDDFKKVEIKIGKILSAEKVEGSDKLLRLEVDFGVEEPKTEQTAEGETFTEAAVSEEPKRIIRQIIAGIAQYYSPDHLIGKECPFAYNLEPRKLKGLESQGMILCPAGGEGPVLLHPDKQVPPGAEVR